MRLWITMAALAAVLVLLSGCSGVGTLNALTARNTHVLTADLAYGPDPRQRLDLYTPATAPPPAGWPVVVFFYGGTWTHGDRADYRFVGEALAARGVLTLVADYRLHPQVRYPAFLHDSARALAFGLEHAAALRGDPRKVFVMGHSAGGYNAAMLALDPRWLRDVGHAPRELAGWIGLAGPYDFLPTENPEAQPVFFHPHYPPGAQPIEHTPRTAPRSFLAAPVEDTLVSPDRSTRQLARRLLAVGVPVSLHFYPRASHQTLIGAFAWPLRFIAPVLDDVVRFIQETPAPR